MDHSQRDQCTSPSEFLIPLKARGRLRGEEPLSFVLSLHDVVEGPTQTRPLRPTLRRTEGFGDLGTKRSGCVEYLGRHPLLCSDNPTTFPLTCFWRLCTYPCHGLLLGVPLLELLQSETRDRSYTYVYGNDF